MNDPALIRRINAARTVPLGIYRDAGWDDRFDYIEQLAERHGVGIRTVIEMADMLGPEEDFDGLACAVEDAAQGFGFGARG